MGKYIVELESGTHIFVLGPEGIVHIGEPDLVYETVDGMQIGDAVINAKPYTEPDLEQVKKEVFEEGKKQAKVQAELDVCHDIEKVAKANYQQGLNDIWAAARKIHRMPDGDILDLFPDCYAAVCTAAQVILKYDASEVIAKIKAWEDGKQEIKVGDEVGYYGVADEHGNVCYSGIVLEIRKGDYLVMEKDGKTYALKKKLVMSKTGRHFPEIAAVLEKMRGEQDG